VAEGLSRLSADTFQQQLRLHSVALLGLAVALTGRAYNRWRNNTWRNQQTEVSRNVRVAGVEVILKLGELERVVFFSHYDQDTMRGNFLTIRDPGSLTGPRVDMLSAELLSTRRYNRSGLGKSNEATNRFSAAIDDVRIMC